MSLTHLGKVGLPLSFLLPVVGQLHRRFAVLLCLHVKELVPNLLNVAAAAL